MHDEVLKRDRAGKSTVLQVKGVLDDAGAVMVTLESVKSIQDLIWTLADVICARADVLRASAVSGDHRIATKDVNIKES